MRRAVSSAVERLPYKQVVIGSNPIPPTTFCKYNIKCVIRVRLDNKLVLSNLMFIFGGLIV